MHRRIWSFVITKTCLYKFHPLQPHFYIVKLGFTGVYIIFLILLNNMDCRYSLEPPRRGGSNEYPQSMFWAEIWKISAVLSDNFWIFEGEIFYIFEQACFRNVIRCLHYIDLPLHGKSRPHSCSPKYLVKRHICRGIQFFSFHSFCIIYWNFHFLHNFK